MARVGFELVVVADDMLVVYGVETAEEPASARATCKKSAPAATMLVRQQATALSDRGVTMTGQHVYSHRHSAMDEDVNTVTNEVMDKHAGVANAAMMRQAAQTLQAWCARQDSNPAVSCYSRNSTKFGRIRKGGVHCSY